MADLKATKEDKRLSYSSSTLIKNCETKYFHYKVAKTPMDADASKRDNSHFAIGKAFHYILEKSLHEKPKKIVNDLEECVQDMDISLSEEHIPLVHAMILKYLRLRKQSSWKAVAVEYAIEDPKVIGYVDLVEVNDRGEWTITDLKTASSFFDSKISMLASDPQLNLYAYFAPQIAEKFNLDLDKFIGVRYLVTTKLSKMLVKKATDSYEDYVLRLADSKQMKSIHIFIPKALMRIEENYKEFIADYERSIELRGGSAPKRNYSYCNAFFRGCDYFSQCHGMEYEEFMESNKIIVERI